MLESLDLPKFASVLRESHLRQIPGLKPLGPVAGGDGELGGRQGQVTDGDGTGGEHSNGWT